MGRLRTATARAHAAYRVAALRAKVQLRAATAQLSRAVHDYRAAVTVQCAVRQVLARRLLVHLRTRAACAALTLQCAYRVYLARKEVHRRYMLSARYSSAVTLQAVFRGHCARKQARVLRAARVKAATVVQVCC